MKYALRIRGLAEGKVTNKTMEKAIDEIMVRLLARGVEDPDINTEVSKSSVEVSLIIEAKSSEAALSKGLSFLQGCFSKDLLLDLKIDWLSVTGEIVEEITAKSA